MLKEDLKRLILESFIKQGFTINQETSGLSLKSNDKDIIRSLHDVSRIYAIDKNRDFIERNFKDCSVFFANGGDINIHKFFPVVIPVEQESDSARLYRFSSLLWSIPVSTGFGM